MPSLRNIISILWHKNQKVEYLASTQSNHSSIYFFSYSIWFQLIHDSQSRNGPGSSFVFQSTLFSKGKGEASSFKFCNFCGSSISLFFCSSTSFSMWRMMFGMSWWYFIIFWWWLRHWSADRVLTHFDIMTLSLMDFLLYLDAWNIS